MEFSDLYEFPEGFPPSPYGKPVLVVKVGNGVLPPALTLRAIGWLERPGFAIGNVPKGFLDAIVAAHKRAVFSDGYRGMHGCTLCGQEFPEIRWKRRKIAIRGHGHYLVQLGEVVYMAPALLLHYIVDHKYCPPAEFVEAVLKGRFLTIEDLIIHWRRAGDDETAEPSIAH